VLAAAFALILPAAARAATADVRVLAFNDFHGNFARGRIAVAP
jgi:2',3'-cyclic-nucleotide 2'-phosphodiesterase (5'-nucleotidase family)